MLPHRARLEEARLRLVEDELAARLALGSAGSVVGDLEAQVLAHPLRERSWALLITALYQAGRQADALAAHRRVTRLLADELGIDPGAELAAVAQRVLTHDPALDVPAPRPPAAPRGNVPGLTTALVGRGDELDALLADLRNQRLVTLVGPAGVGQDAPRDRGRGALRRPGRRLAGAPGGRPRRPPSCRPRWPTSVPGPRARAAP